MYCSLNITICMDISQIPQKVHMCVVIEGLVWAEGCVKQAFTNPATCWWKPGQAISSLNETREVKVNASPTLVPTVDNWGFLFSEKINLSLPHFLCSVFFSLLFLRFFGLLVEITCRVIHLYFSKEHIVAFEKLILFCLTDFCTVPRAV